METIVETYKWFDIKLFVSSIDDSVWYTSYNPQENYMIPWVTLEDTKKKIDERYRSR